MPEFKLAYGERFVLITVPEDEEVTVGVILPIEPKTPSIPETELIETALDAPVNSPLLEDVVKAAHSVCIVTSDGTRPLPTHRILPHIVHRLIKSGLSYDNISVVFGRGIHRPQTELERRRLLGDPWFDRIRSYDSDPGQVLCLGHTSRGTPVNLDRRVAEADRVICLGNVEHHYFAGYSGGAKALLPGVADGETVKMNHRWMLDPKACLGSIVGNPVREDIEEVLRFRSIDFFLNVVLDPNHRIVFAAAGHPIDAHRQAVDVVDERSTIDIQRAADLVIASAGGSPKDMNLYQAQKAIETARTFARPGAPIVLIAACSEQYGNEAMARWLSTANSAAELVERLEDSFELGGHKAAMLARAALEHPLWLLSEMSECDTRRAFMTPWERTESVDQAKLSLPEAVWSQARQVADDGAGPHIVILPKASSVIGRLEG